MNLNHAKLKCGYDLEILNNVSLHTFVQTPQNAFLKVRTAKIQSWQTEYIVHGIYTTAAPQRYFIC